MQLKQTVSLKLSQDTGATPQLLIADFSEAFTEQEDYNEGASHLYRLETATTDEQLSLGSVSSAEGLAIICDRAIEIKFNDTDGTNRSITLRENKLSVVHADFTALYASNNSGDPAIVRYAVWGD